jgi:hypothetical protein
MDGFATDGAVHRVPLRGDAHRPIRAAQQRGRVV